jgi:hypothetical protein
MRILLALALVVAAFSLAACCGEEGGDCSDHGGVNHKNGQYTYCKDGTGFGPTGELGGGG